MPGRSGWVPGFGAKANITVTIDLQDLKSATADAIGDLVYGDGLSAATIRRLACDAKIIPLVLGSKSEPLDVGRAERLVTGAMRRALNARDKGCVVCGAPPVQCDAHHLQSWIDGGTTAVHNLVLLCKRHHIDLHAGDWTITITDGMVHVARPAWADPPPQHPNQPTRQANPVRPTHQPVPPRTGPSPSGRSRTASAHIRPVPIGPSRTASPGAGTSSSGQSSAASPRTEPSPLGQFRTASAVELGLATPSPEQDLAAAPGGGAGSDVRSLLSPSGIRGGMLQRLLLGGREGAGGMAPSAVREAVSLAIWGEVPAPIGGHADSDGSALVGDRAGGLGGERAVDPWGDSAGVVGPGS